MNNHNINKLIHDFIIHPLRFYIPVDVWQPLHDWHSKETFPPQPQAQKQDSSANKMPVDCCMTFRHQDKMMGFRNADHEAAVLGAQKATKQDSNTPEVGND